MADLVEVEYLDGSTDIVTISEAEAAREAGELKEPVPNNLALTKDDFYGEGYDS